MGADGRAGRPPDLDNQQDDDGDRQNQHPEAGNRDLIVDLPARGRDGAGAPSETGGARKRSGPTRP